MKLNRTLTQLTAAGLLAAATAHGALVPVTSDIAANTTQTWYATNQYRLDTIVYVQTNATLIIEPGTVVYGGTNAANLIAKPGIPNLVSALWVTRGGKLYATGTVDRPIIMTMEGDDVSSPNDIPPTVTGQWGGVVLMGRATVNSAFDGVGNASSPVTDVYEGVSSEGPNAEHRFGGNDDNDSSGALRYVSIRHTGRSFALDKELNSLTMGGVGRGTVIEYVESFASSDDAFEWWGGTVNTKYLVAAFCEDDDFDTDQGYTGTNQFWFGIKPPWQGSVDSRGFETDGDVSQTVLGDRTPFSQWAVFNATIIGRGKANTSFGGGRGWNCRDEAAPNVFNTAVVDFNTGLLLDADGLYHWTNTTVRASAYNNVWDVTTAASSGIGEFVFTNASFNNSLLGAALGGISYTNDVAGLDPRPQAGSPLLTNVLAGAPVATSYRGAFSGANDNWADGWTALSQEGYLKASSVKPTVVVTADIAANTTATWKNEFEYRLDTIVYVQTNAVLVIEPGTVVKGGTNAANLIAKPGIPNLVSGLWVTRGGKLYATGTVTSPIIMTMEGDDVNNPSDIPPTVTGQWGGVVLMGRATVNSAFDGVGNASSPVTDVYEGVSSEGPNAEHRFGGNDDNDSSGALRYVSIRHTGRSFALDKELNSLTMGGVGRGTTIEYVESYASSDDAFEWWGGTVNTKHLIAAFCEDDDFDTDQGYTGTNQFWFGIKPPWQGSVDSRGFETDGDVSQTVLGDRLPYSVWRVDNATLIGRGKANTSFGGGRGWNARDEAAPNVFNSAIVEFNTGLLLDTDGLFHWTNTTVRAHAQNNIWDVTTADANGNGAFLFTNAVHNNSLLAAGLAGISYTNDVAGLNPRPQTGSPLLTNVLAGALEAASYRGAFSGQYDSWADGWTALSTEGYLAQAATPPAPPVVVTADIGDGVTPTTVNWYATNQYRLDTIVYVQSNAVLVIEPGTVVYGGTNAANLLAKPGIPNLVSGLWITRGGKLYATGTVAKPIIFTMEGDDVNDPNDIPPTVTGQWGGVILMGRATVNSAFDGVGNASSPVTDVYEGVSSEGPNGEHRFGGNDDNDSSGALRYVSIRHTGRSFALDKELNSLTMGGVGRGTVIEYVESFASSDDAFEWWGGTVNTKYLIAAFCEDDDFDTDQGYTGTNQFWFGIKPTWQGSVDSRGFETDGDVSQTVLGDRLPYSVWRVDNATLIGRGKANTSFGGGRAWNARDEAAPNVFNTAFVDFNTGLLLDADGLFHWTNSIVRASAQNNVWDVTTAASSGIGEFVFTNASFNNTVAAALLGGISYTNDVAGLDPRPQAGSPLLTGVLAGAQVATTYRGAFKPNDSWADCWSALSQEGYLAVSKPELTIQPVGGSVQISWLGLPGKTYQLESTTSLSAPISWGNEGAAVVGTGDVITVTVPATGNKYFQVVMN
jgi:hypothetical protein